MALYNEFDPNAAQWLTNLMAAGHISPGVVDGRSIKELGAADVAGTRQAHFFAGIGVWSHALRLAGWPDDAPVWSGSCPCQPFSTAGRGKGVDDARHLWPEWFRLIRIGRPAIVVGEQVASPDGLAWLDAIHADLEGEGYAVAAFDLCAAGVGAPHIRQRLYFAAVRLADPAQGGRGWGAIEQGSKRNGSDARRSEGERFPESRSETRGLADPTGARRKGSAGGGCDGSGGLRGVAGAHGGLGDADGRGGTAGLPESTTREAGFSGVADDTGSESTRTGLRPTPGFWGVADWLQCRDGKLRPVEPGTFPLAHGAAGRVGRLRAYGNAIVAPLAATFLEALKPSVAHLFAEAA